MQKEMHKCETMKIVTCGNCGRSWCEHHDGAPSALCHWCHGRGYSTAPVVDHSDDVAFFWAHAGYSYDPKTETPEQGRRRCAIEYAEAEQWAREQGAVFNWSDDWDVDHEKEFDCYDDGGPETCERVAMYIDNELVASLGCIDGATNEYRRVVEAELADEAKYDADEQQRTLDPHGYLAALQTLADQTPTERFYNNCRIVQVSADGEDDGLTWFHCNYHNKDTLFELSCQ